jgi:AraC-like DNA-binding protein
MKIIREHVSLSEKHPFLISVFENENVNLNYPFHQHKFAYELTITLGVSGTRMVGDSTEQFIGEDVVLMAPGLPHCWQDHGIQTQENCKVVVIQFLDQLVPQAIRNADFNIQLISALKQANFGLELLEDQKNKVVAWASKLQARSDFQTFHELLAVLNMFGEKNMTRRLCSTGYSKPEFRGETGRLETVLQYIQEKYSRKLRIADVADQIHMSPSAFSHYFKKRTLKSFADFVLDMRLGKAAQLLQHTDLLVTQIGYESGFQNISHFNRSFKKKYNQTPLKFRNRLRSAIRNK